MARQIDLFTRDGWFSCRFARHIYGPGLDKINEAVDERPKRAHYLECRLFKFHSHVFPTGQIFVAPSLWFHDIVESKEQKIVDS